MFTTGKLSGNRLYLVDSKFDEPVAKEPYEVVVLKVCPAEREPCLATGTARHPEQLNLTSRIRGTRLVSTCAV